MLNAFLKFPYPSLNEAAYFKRGNYEVDINNMGITTGTYFCELRIDGIHRKIIAFPYMKK